MKNKTVVGPELSPDWVKKIGTMLAEVFRQLCLGLQGSRQGLTLEQVQLFIEHRNPFAKVADGFAELKAEWRAFYKECLNMDVDFSMLTIPKCPGSGWRLLIIAQGVLPEQVFQAMKNFFRVWKCTDKSLDDLVIYNERDSRNGAYAIWVRDNREADEAHKNKSANQVKAEKLSTETLAEREIHELKYFRETGKHLDINNVTLCSGSRYDDGDVPSVDWSRGSDGFSVSWYNPDDSDDDLRAREVVS